MANMYTTNIRNISVYIIFGVDVGVVEAPPDSRTRAMPPSKLYSVSTNTTLRLITG